MTELERTARNRARLQECYPTFRTAVAGVLARLEADGFRPRIQGAYMTPADERAAFASGHSEVPHGFHGITNPDGTPAALAVDVLDDNAALAPGRAYLCALTREALAAGLATGILWGLPASARPQVLAAIRAGDTWSGPLGWDPTHVEPAGITIAQALAGQRP